MTAEQHCSGHGAYNAYCASCVNLRLAAAIETLEQVRDEERHWRLKAEARLAAAEKVIAVARDDRALIGTYTADAVEDYDAADLNFSEQAPKNPTDAGSDR